MTTAPKGYVVTPAGKRFHWSIGGQSSSAWPGHKISVTLWIGNRFFPHPVYDGRWFPSDEDGNRFLIEHGFLEPYRTGWCRRCRKEHFFIGLRHEPFPDHRNQRIFDQEARKVFRRRRMEGKAAAWYARTMGVSKWRGRELMYHGLTERAEQEEGRWWPLGILPHPDGFDRKHWTMEDSR